MTPQLVVRDKGGSALRSLRGTSSLARGLNASKGRGSSSTPSH